MAEILNNIVRHKTHGQVSSLLVGKFIKSVIEVLVVHHLLVVKVESAGRIQLVDIIKAESIDTDFADTFVGCLSQSLEPVIDLLVSHHLIFAETFFDNRTNLAINNGHSRVNCVVYLTTTRLKSTLLVDGKKPSFRPLGHLDKVISNERLFNLCLLLLFQCNLFVKCSFSIGLLLVNDLLLIDLNLLSGERVLLLNPLNLDVLQISGNHSISLQQFVQLLGLLFLNLFCGSQIALCSYFGSE